MEIVKDKILDAKEEAKKEIEKEEFDKVKTRYKKLFKDLTDAKKVVKNLEREIEDLELELSESK